MATLKEWLINLARQYPSREKQVTIRMSAEDHRQLVRAAKEMGVTQSEFSRACLQLAFYVYYKEES